MDGKESIPPFHDAVPRVLAALDESGIEYMVVGSFAASLYGVSRATHDLDVVVVLSLDSLDKLQQALGEDFFFDEEAARIAVQRSDMFNVLHLESGLKVDFWVREEDEYSQEQFKHRRTSDAWGYEGLVSSPEDTILSKLLWYKITPSDRQLGDVRDMLIVNRGHLDYDYLQNWAAKINVAEILNNLIEEIECLEHQ